MNENNQPTQFDLRKGILIFNEKESTAFKLVTLAIIILFYLACFLILREWFLAYAAKGMASGLFKKIIK